MTTLSRYNRFQGKFTLFDTVPDTEFIKPHINDVQYHMLDQVSANRVEVPARFDGASLGQIPNQLLALNLIIAVPNLFPDQGP